MSDKEITDIICACVSCIFEPIKDCTDDEKCGRVARIVIILLSIAFGYLIQLQIGLLGHH